MDQYSPYRTSWKTLDKHSIQWNLMEHSWINILPPNITDRGITMSMGTLGNHPNTNNITIRGVTMCYRTSWKHYVINGILQKGTTQCVEAHEALGNLLEFSLEHDGILAELHGTKGITQKGIEQYRIE